MARGNDFLSYEYALHDKPVIFRDSQGTKPICRAEKCAGSKESPTESTHPSKIYVHCGAKW